MTEESKRISEIQRELQDIESHKQKLLVELKILESSKSEKVVSFAGEPIFSTPPETPENKISLFLKLFRCRDDLFPKYWENKRSEKKRYSPVCTNEWKRKICYKPNVKCSDCVNQAFMPFDKNAAWDHLTGKTTIGSYAINGQDRCIFLAADFDKSTWKEDVIAYQSAAEELHVQVAIEISKSGNGAHAWIFFNELVSACKARKLGDIILSNAMDSTNKLNLDSYDRFFPNQDYMPSGGFGNLIALPLQKEYRKQNRSVFVNKQMEVYPDQWEFLSSVHCLYAQDLDLILNKHLISLEYQYTNNRSGNEIKIDSDLYIAESILNVESEQEDQFSGTIEIIIDSQIAVPLKELPATVLRQLKKLATIANPKFFETQALRFSTWNIPKYIFCGENDSDFIFLPRGKLNNIIHLLTASGFEVLIKDNRNVNEQIELSFEGELFKHQQSAVQAIIDTDFCVLVAPTGTGKTVIAINLITIKKMRTLILVHRSTLIDQWID
ncbi:hypothetical protein B4O97_04200 [Marispirochaeta aestuarii]|uniref:Uncharacterized protein n=1 Tax=Marispirochaeta aestuarii TaxID=1963862 RepID=A0A1Y1S1N5_9SPIO|nr:hypothetical protein B4O97_04200 [Marispirochaeta aestuarii]